jgi:hypothetical protein
MSNVEVSQALTQLAEIQDKLSRVQVYRGYRPLTVALTGICALLGGWLSLQHAPEVVWPSIATLCLLVVGGEMAYDYWTHFSKHQQRLARCVLLQFLPGIGVSAAWTACWLHSGHSPALLPSLWAICYSHCLFGSRTYLPSGIGYVATFYGLCGLALCTPYGLSHFNSGMTITFGLGQLLLALVLHWNQPREVSL